MAKRKFGAILLLSVIVPLLVSTIILIIVVMVLPNSEPRTESVSQDGQSTGSKTKQQLSPLSYKTKSRVLFILGVTFACSLFVFLIVIIAVACARARKAKGCVVGDQNSEVTSQVYNNVDCQLTKHTERVSEGNQTKYCINTRKDRVNAITTAAPPSPLVKTVAVPTQVSSRNSGERDVDDNLQNFYIHGRETCPIVQPTSYGTLGRTHLLSTVDEDGYHVDNLGFDSEEANTEEFLSSIGKRQSSAPGCQQSFPIDISESVGTIQPSTAERQNTTVASAEVEYSDQDNKSQKHLSKQDSFQGLPPLRPFDRYLTLVRLDSDTSLESYSLEATRNIWKSIDEEDEKEESMMVQKEEAFNKQYTVETICIMSQSSDKTQTSTVVHDDLPKIHETEDLIKVCLQNTAKRSDSEVAMEAINEKTGKPSESLVKSVFNCQGSVNYHNSGWKKTPPVRKGSSSSMKSNSSNRSSLASSPSPASPSTKSPTEQQAYLESQYIEIFNILKDCHIDEAILLKIKN